MSAVLILAAAAVGYVVGRWSRAGDTRSVKGARLTAGDQRPTDPSWLAGIDPTDAGEVGEWPGWVAGPPVIRYALGGTERPPLQGLPTCVCGRVADGGAHDCPGAQWSYTGGVQ